MKTSNDSVFQNCGRLGVLPRQSREPEERQKLNGVWEEAAGRTREVAAQRKSQDEEVKKDAEADD